MKRKIAALIGCVMMLTQTVCGAELTSVSPVEMQEDISISEDAISLESFSETAAPAEFADPAETPAPTEVVVSEETPAPTEAVVSEETPTPTEAVVSEETPAPTEAVLPEETPAPTEVVVPEETTVPTEAAVSTETTEFVETIAPAESLIPEEPVSSSDESLQTTLESTEAVTEETWTESEILEQETLEAEVEENTEQETAAGIPGEILSVESFGGNGLEEYRAICISDPGEKGLSFQTQELYASDPTFDSYGSRYGYNDLLNRSNGVKRQALYEKFRTLCEQIMASPADFSANPVYHACIMNEIDVSSDHMTVEEVVETYFMFRSDNPQYFWLSNSFYFSYDPLAEASDYANGCYIALYEEYSTAAVRNAHQNQISSKLAEYKAVVAAAGTSISGKVKAIHDKLVDEIDYARTASGAPETAYWAHSIAGSLGCDGHYKAVCEGYAKVMQMMCTVSGINNILVVGKAGSENHAWNYICLEDNRYYGLDATWDDVGSHQVVYTYFLKEQESFLNMHQPFTPEGTGSTFQYALPALSNAGNISGYQPSTVTIAIGDQVTPVLMDTSGVASCMKLDLSSSNRAIASTNGTVITGVAVGNTTITSTCGSKTFSISVSVSNEKIGKLDSPTLTATKNANGTTSLRWSGSSGAQGYYVYRKAAGGAWSVIHTVNAAVLSCEEKAEGYGTFYYAVRAFRTINGKTELSDYTSSLCKTVVNLPPYITMTSASVQTDHSVKLEWDADSGVSGYRLFRKAYGGGWGAIATIWNPATNSYVDRTAMAGEYYAYTVRAFYVQNNKVCWGYYQTWKTCWITLNTPHVERVDMTALTTCVLRWDAVDGADGYTIFRRASGEKWTTLGNVNARTVSYTDNSVTYGKTYAYTVRAYNSFSKTILRSGYENPGVVIGVALSAPALKSAAAVNNGISVSWGTVPYAQGYTVYRKTEGSGWKILYQVAGAVTSYTDKTAVSGTKYTYTVRAYATNAGALVRGFYDANGVSCTR